MARYSRKGEDGLNDQQRIFCNEYVIDRNGARAAIRAGYSPKTARSKASQLLTNINVKKYVEERLGDAIKRLEIQQDRVYRELVRVGLANIQDVVSWSDGRVTFKDSAALNEDITAAVTEVKRTVKKIPYGDEYIEEEQMSLRMADKYRALKDLVTIAQMVKGKGENATNVTIVDERREQANRVEQWEKEQGLEHSPD